MIKVAVCGACGKMGQRIVRTANEQEDMKIVGAIDKPETPEEGKDIGEVAGIENLGVEIVGADKIGEELEKSEPDVLVDFTIAEAAVKNVKAACEASVPIVVGTTGFSDEQREEMKKAIEDANISAIIAPNMSLGVNTFFKLIKDVAAKLEDYDMELIESHHNQKIDAPSGTALTAAQIAAEASGKDFENVAKFGRSKGKHGERPEDEIGIHAIRAGDIAGKHKFIFAGPSERLELVHKAQSRQAFASGVMKAIRFITEKGDPGTILDMQDVLFGK